MGFKSKKKNYRLTSRLGRFNVMSVGASAPRWMDFYHYLMSLPWFLFFTFFITTYLAVNFVFAAYYFSLGHGALGGMKYANEWERALECFFFSVQTLATIGYGRISPENIPANIGVTIEAIFGILMMAIGTGLFFSRFSRPTAKIIFSDKAIITNLDGVPCLVYRLANSRMNQIAEARVHLEVVYDEVTKEGESFRSFTPLKLERDFNPVFAISWTCIHPIDNTSFLFNKTEKDFRDLDISFITTVTGVDDIFSQSIYARYSYATEDILWNRRFADILGEDKDGTIVMDIGKIHDTEPIRI